MKATHFMKIAALALIVASCHTKKHAVVEEPTPITEKQQNLFDRVDGASQRKTAFVSSKLKFSITVGDQQLSLTGNLHMKRNDVIRMQLMAFGFVEAARVEFTQDYVLIIDRINKQYLKAPYFYIDFLRNSGINFYTLQALFWNELFQPGKQVIDDEARKAFTTDSIGAGESIITFERDRMEYSWLVNDQTGIIRMSNIIYRDALNGNGQLNWDYRGFKELAGKPFPSDMLATLTLPTKEVQVGIKLNYLNNNSDWETRTRVSDKYHEVDFDEILRRFMAL